MNWALTAAYIQIVDVGGCVSNQCVSSFECALESFMSAFHSKNQIEWVVCVSVFNLSISICVSSGIVNKWNKNHSKKKLKNEINIFYYHWYWIRWMRTFEIRFFILLPSHRMCVCVLCFLWFFIFVLLDEWANAKVTRTQQSGKNHLLSIWNECKWRIKQEDERENNFQHFYNKNE